MAASFAKLTVGRSGLGAAHASYITRMSALDPDHNARERETPERSVTATLNEDLDEQALGRSFGSAGAERRDDDPIWTWNVPDYITGDSYGIEQVEGSNRSPNDVQANERMLAEKMAAKPRRSEHRLTLKEKIENARTYFASREEFEEAKGGRTHYRMVLSFDVKATNGQIKELTNKFLGQSFPKAMAFAAIHRDTEHPHVHIYIHSRQVDGRKIQLTNDQFRAIDEKWSNIYSEFAGDRSIHVEHLRKKEETREWKRAAALAYRKGEPIPPKPERDNDRRERLAEQRLSAQRSEVRERGVDPGSRPQAEPVMRPKSERETARLIAKEHMAREVLAHLVRTDAPHKDIDSAARTAQGLRAALDKTVEARHLVGKEKLPAPTFTIEESKRLVEYKQSREVVRDDWAAARVVAQQKIAEAEARHAQIRVEGFELRRHLWKLDVEGWERKISLKDIEQQIQARQAEKLEVLNFIRPGKRGMIQGQIDYLREVKADIQKQLAGMRELIGRDLKTAELRRDVANEQVEQARGQRAAWAGECLGRCTRTRSLRGWPR